MVDLVVLRLHDIYKILGSFWSYSHWIPPCNNLVCAGWGTAYARGNSQMLDADQAHSQM